MKTPLIDPYYHQNGMECNQLHQVTKSQHCCFHISRHCNQCKYLSSAVTSAAPRDKAANRTPLNPQNAEKEFAPDIKQTCKTRIDLLL